MAGYSSWGELKAAIQDEMRAAMEEAMENSFQALKQDTVAFYVGTPRVYDRTYAFGDSPRRSEIGGGGDELFGSVYMDGNYTYSTGMKPSGYTVFSWAEAGAMGIIGRTSTWATAEIHIENEVNSAFASHFS